MHTKKDASPIDDNPNYVHLYDLHNEIFFIVDSASPRSILPASAYQEQAQTLHNIPSLFASNSQPLSVYMVVLICFYNLRNYHISMPLCRKIRNCITSLTGRLIRIVWQTVGINSFLDLISQKHQDLLHQTNIIIDPT